MVMLYDDDLNSDNEQFDEEVSPVTSKSRK